MKIIGMRKEIFIDYDERHEENYENTKWIICGIKDYYPKQKVEISLWEHDGDCYSGWCSASWGNCEIKEVNEFGGYTHKPKKDIHVPDDLVEKIGDWGEQYVSNDVFEVDYDGGDNYYPSGHVTVNEDLFIETIRSKARRPVWIFVGDSNSGKSYLSHMTEKSVYETDSNSELPVDICEDIVVLGNKYDFTVDDVVARLFGDVEVIKVNFSICN